MPQPDAAIILVGNITEPKIQFSKSGTAFVNFSLPVQERRKNDDTGKWEDEGDPSWYRCVAFNQLAENIAESCPKGTRVIVRGRIKMSNWTDKEGAERTSAEVTVDDFGIDLRFATAEVHKIEREKRSGGSSDSSGGSSSNPFG